MIRVVIAEDQAIIRTGLRALAERDGDIEVTAEAADGRAAVALTREHRPDVVLMDIRMPGVDGVMATQLIAHDPELGPNLAPSGPSCR
jgi:YesN/AraC family two-component response regulator